MISQHTTKQKTSPNVYFNDDELSLLNCLTNALRVKSGPVHLNTTLFCCIKINCHTG